MQLASAQDILISDTAHALIEGKDPQRLGLALYQVVLWGEIDAEWRNIANEHTGEQAAPIVAPFTELNIGEWIAEAMTLPPEDAKDVEIEVIPPPVAAATAPPKRRGIIARLLGL